MADRTLAATADLDVTVLYATTVRPFDAATLRATLDTPAVVLVEPYLRDTSTADRGPRARRPSRTGCSASASGPAELRIYGSRADHDARHGLDERGLRSRIAEFLR